MGYGEAGKSWELRVGLHRVIRIFGCLSPESRSVDEKLVMKLTNRIIYF